jgi:hypothetical protein
MVTEFYRGKGLQLSAMPSDRVRHRRGRYGKTVRDDEGFSHSGIAWHQNEDARPGDPGADGSAQKQPPPF